MQNNVSHDPVIQLNDVRQAASRIQGHVLRTPVIPSESLAGKLDCRVWFKAENLQYIGAFKARGAANAVLSLSEEIAKCGVVTHSSGNHAAALARAACRRGIPAYVVMPHNSSVKKIQAVRKFGVEPVFCEPTTEAREQTAEVVRLETNATMVHPYDSPDVMAGQGTIGLELLEQIDDLDSVLVPVGGGGLLSGVLTAIKSIRPEVRVIAVEPAWADDTARSLKAGCPQSPNRYDSVADGLRTGVGKNTFPIIQSLVDDILLVEEQAISSAMRLIAEEAHLVVEPSGAVAFAGLWENATSFQGQSVAVILSGGNLNFGECRLGS